LALRSNRDFSRRVTYDWRDLGFPRRHAPTGLTFVLGAFQVPAPNRLWAALAFSTQGMDAETAPSHLSFKVGAPSEKMAKPSPAPPCGSSSTQVRVTSASWGLTWLRDLGPESYRHAGGKMPTPRPEK